MKVIQSNEYIGIWDDTVNVITFGEKKYVKCQVGEKTTDPRICIIVINKAFYLHRSFLQKIWIDIYREVAQLNNSLITIISIREDYIVGLEELFTNLSSPNPTVKQITSVLKFSLLIGSSKEMTEYILSKIPNSLSVCEDYADLEYLRTNFDHVYFAILNSIKNMETFVSTCPALLNLIQIHTELIKKKF